MEKKMKVTSRPALVTTKGGNEYSVKIFGRILEVFELPREEADNA
jgi:hypothetical protein